jgi:hypothetical protein
VSLLELDERLKELSRLSVDSRLRLKYDGAISWALVSGVIEGVAEGDPPAGKSKEADLEEVTDLDLTNGPCLSKSGVDSDDWF